MLSVKCLGRCMGGRMYWSSILYSSVLSWWSEIFVLTFKTQIQISGKHSIRRFNVRTFLYESYTYLGQHTCMNSLLLIHIVGILRQLYHEISTCITL